MRKITLFCLLVFLFACGQDEIIINETFYKIYETELSGTVKSLPTADLGLLVLEPEQEVVGTTNSLSVAFPRLSKYDRNGDFQWEFRKGTSYFRPLLMVEKEDYFVLFTYTVLDQAGTQKADYESLTNLAEVHIDKKTGKEVKYIVRPANATTNIPRQVLKNGNYLGFDASKIGTSSENLQLISTNNWDRTGNISYLDKSNTHFVFEQRVQPNNANTANFVTLTSQDLSSVSTVCFSSLDISLTAEQDVITNVYPLNNEEYIFVFYSRAGLQTSIYFTPPISLKAEIESEVLKEPYFQKNYEKWTKETADPEVNRLKAKYGSQFRYPLRSKEIFERATKAGTVYRTFDLDFNDRETFIIKAKDRILIIRNSGGYQILIYEYLIAEKKFKLLQTLGRNIPYYLQDASANEIGDLFISGNTQIAKDLNSLFIIKIPYEDLPK